MVSNLNFSPGWTVPNQVMVRTSQPNLMGLPAASVVFYNPYGYTHLIIDLFGFFTNANVNVSTFYTAAAATASEASPPAGPRFAHLRALPAVG